MQSIKDLEVGSMKSHAITVAATLPISKLIRTLKGLHAYEAFVVDASRMGMVTMRDLLRVKNVSTRNISTLVMHLRKLLTEHKVGEGPRIMSEYRIRALPMMNGNDPVGVIQVQSMLMAMKSSELGGSSASEAMASLPMTVQESTSTMKARNLMIRRDIDHVPVVRSKDLRDMLDFRQIVFNMIAPECARKHTRVRPTRHASQCFDGSRPSLL
jgi:CBS domain-containing protein